MSTHDLSTIVRNTQSPGTLVPNLCLVGQKGDTFDIDIDANVLTHPTTGPLFGSFKLEHHIYAAPVRLYNSWLHNNRTKIGLNMAQVKAKLSVWTPESKNTLISNLATESGWLSKQTIIENSPHAAPDEVERKKKEDELATQNVASDSGSVMQTTTNQNI